MVDSLFGSNFASPLVVVHVVAWSGILAVSEGKLRHILHVIGSSVQLQCQQHMSPRSSMHLVVVDFAD